MRTTSFSRTLHAIMLAVVVSVLHMVPANAQQSPVYMAGTAQYKLQRIGSAVTAAGSVDQVVNNSSLSFSNVRIILALSKKAYTPGAVIGVSTLASTSVGDLPAYTYMNNISLSGSGRSIKGGKIRVLMLAVDGANRILGGITFSKSLSMKALPLTAQALGLEGGSEHAFGQLVEARH